MLKKIVTKELRDWKYYIGIILGCIISGAGLGLFLVPNSIASGGVTGAAVVINNFIPLAVGKMSILLNIPIFVVCIIVLGSSFGFKSFFATIFLGFTIDYFVCFPIPTHDIFLSSVYGGLLVGLGLGIVIKNNATTGGTDLIAKIFHKIFPFISLGQILLIVDSLVILSAIIVFKSVEIGLYAAISLYITTMVIDAVLLGIDFARAVYIVSDKSDEISKSILEKLDRGVTGLHGKGMFTGTDKTVLLCVIRKRDIHRLKSLVKSIDSNAFVFLSEVREVFGEGFTPHE